MERFRSTSVRRVAGAVAVMVVALALTTLAVAVLEDRLRIPDASATYLLAVTAIEFIGDDELVEVTPGSIRLRKRRLSQHDRHRQAGRREDAREAEGR